MGESGSQTILYIRMLGGFHMTYLDKPVVMGKSSGKMLWLFLMLIYFRKEGIPRQQLLDQLYGDCDMEQASNSLRAIVYRLRKSLIAAGLPEGEYITTKGGVYRFLEDDVEIELDAEEFQEKAVAALEETEPVEQLQLLEEACRMYQGEFLPTMIADAWVSAANWKYQELYFKCLREMTRLLESQQDYQKLLNYCEQALSKYPYEEWQLVKLDCLAAMKEYKTALDYYEQVTSDFQREFGMPPSEEMLKRYRAIKNMVQYEMSSIEDIQLHLQPDADVMGATRCDYLTFIDIFRYIVWVLERKGINAYLTLFTLVDKEGVPLKTSGLLEDTRQTLEKAISTSVRKSDLYSRYGKNQFLMLMIDVEQPGCETACERIRSRFHSLNRRKKVNICYTQHAALDIPDDAIRNNMNQGLKDLKPRMDGR